MIASPLRRFAAAAAALVCALTASGASSDPDAGSWRMIVLSGPTQIAVAPPAAVTDSAYLAEIAAVKTAQAQITEAQRQAVDYWSRGGVLRWNEILMELVSRADLPPAPTAAGTYPAPDANNPFADPQYPFSNPPYAARAYSYVALAQYEALKVAWYYKYRYNRPSPAKLDSAVQPLMPAMDLPAYPSEDAVVSGVTAEILKLLFPASVEEITLKAGEQRQAALLAGRATASDIAAGLALGQAVAAVFTARAGTDGMKGAGGTPAQIQAMSDAAAARGEIPWKSLETPPRPPMLPLFSAVTGWMMTPADILKERPASPPSTSSPQMAKELAEVRQTVDSLTRDQIAIAYKWSDGASSPTPPGHWNYIAQPYIVKAQFSEVRAARALALLNMAMHDGAIACWDAKYTYYNPRPSQLDPRIRTIVGLPNFPSYVSGHSTFSAAAALVLSYLFPDGAPYFDAQMEEAAISRLYGGIHYRSDIEVGKDLGKRVGGYTVRFAQQDGADHAGNFNASTAEVLESAGFTPSLTAGSLAAVFAPILNAEPGARSDGLAVVFEGAIAAPVVSSGPGQANIQIPWELRGARSATLTITQGGRSTTVDVPLSETAPAIFSVNQQGAGQGVVIDARTGALADAAGPARRGDYVTIYCLGLGAVDRTPPTGQPAPDASSTVKAAVFAMLDGRPVEVSYAGLAPGYLGLYQVNVRIPEDAPAGAAVPLSLAIGGSVSNAVTIAIE